MSIFTRVLRFPHKDDWSEALKRIDTEAITRLRLIPVLNIQRRATGPRVTRDESEFLQPRLRALRHRDWCVALFLSRPLCIIICSVLVFHYHPAVNFGAPLNSTIYIQNTDEQKLPNQRLCAPLRSRDGENWWCWLPWWMILWCCCRRRCSRGKLSSICNPTIITFKLSDFSLSQLQSYFQWIICTGGALIVAIAL